MIPIGPIDPMSHEELMAQRRFVGALARRLVADSASVEDVTQETFVQLLGTRFERPRSLRAWLRMVVRNVARQLGRSDARRAKREKLAASAEPLAAPGAVELAQRLELQRKLIEHVQALRQIHQEVVLLHFYEERTVAQTAARLGIPIETARTRLRRALDELRASWSAELGGERAGQLALLQLAPLSKVASLGALIVTMKTGKVAIAAAVLFAASAGWWFWSGHRGGASSPSAANGIPAAAESAATPAPMPVAVERVNEAPPAPASPVATAPDDGFGSVRVHVTWLRRDSATTPIPDVPVRLTSESHAPAFVDEVEGRTDGQGDFLADRVPVGSVIATAAGFLAYDANGAALKFHERECGKRVVVRAGESSEVKLSVYKEAEVDGVVVDPEGAPVSGATIWISYQLSWPALGTEFGRTDASGRFHLPVVEMIHHISAFAPGYAPSPGLSLSSMEKEGHIEVELQLLDDGGRVRGRVVDAASRPVSHAFVYVSGPWNNPRILREGVIGEHPPARTTRTHADGTFDVEGAPLGDVDLVVRAPGAAPVREQFMLTADAPKSFDLTLRSGGVLEGTLKKQDGSPLEGVSVRVAPAQPLPEPRVDILAAYARTDASGHFKVDHLLAAPLEAEIEAGELGTAKLAFTIADGETREWSPLLSRGAEIRGVVVDDHGAPCRGWKVAARLQKYESGVERPPDVETDEAGLFAMSRCVDRLYEVRVFEPVAGRQPTSFSVVVLHGVKAGGEELRIEVPASARASAFISGRVVDADGQPLPGVALYLYDGGFSSIGFGAGGADGFRLGPFPPSTYSMNLYLQGLPKLHLGSRTLTAGESLDLGTLQMARAGFVEVRARRADGSPLENDDLSIRSEKHDGDEHIGLVGELFRSGPLAPGRYELCGGSKIASMWIPFEIAGGQTVQLTVTIEPGPIRRFRLLDPSGQPPLAPIQVTLSDRSSHALWTHAWPRYRDGPYVVAQRFAPGRYVISFTAADGTKGEAPFEVSDAIDSKSSIDVTLR